MADILVNGGYAPGLTTPMILRYVDQGDGTWALKTVTTSRANASAVSAVRIASSAASGNPAFAKASAGALFNFWGMNAATITYLQLYNKASAPVLGTDTPLLTYPIPASAAFSQAIAEGLSAFTTGIAYAFTTDAAGTTGAAAAAVLAFGLLYA